MSELDGREVREGAGRWVKEDVTAQKRHSEHPNHSHSRATATEAGLLYRWKGLERIRDSPEVGGRQRGYELSPLRQEECHQSFLRWRGQQAAGTAE